MKIFRRTLSVLMSVAIFVCFATVGLTAYAAPEPTESVDSIRWFPANMERNNGFDDMWEAESENSDVFQRFNEADTNPDALKPEISTEYDENGALTVARTGNNPDQAQNALYWPRVRTIYLENAPSIDLTAANTLYYDFTATEKWNIDMMFLSGELKLAKAITEANGGTVENTDGDGPAGTFKGSINLIDTLNAIAADSGDPHSAEANAIVSSASHSFVPQLIFFVVGSIGASCTINSLYIAPEGTDNPADVPLMDMGLVYGDSVYEEEPEEEETTAPEEGSGEETEAQATQTKAPTTAASGENGGNNNNVLLIVGIVALVVIIVAIVVSIVVSKKKSKGEPPKKTE